TKPKACNYGLTLASGDYAVIYDAEDIPDRDQLKQAVATFEAARPELACVQAKLNYYNWNQSWLTRLFTLEYSLWFDLILPGLQAVGAPIPLGGTSNHFRVRDLRAFGGWDPFNVTEDADLGMRLAEAGRTTAIMDSTTLEEANSKYWNWIRQRSRWMKGYIQTYLVHSRSGGRLGGPLARLSFQLVIGSRVLAALLNPWLWGVTAAYFLNVGGVGTYIRSLWLPPVYYLGLTAFVLGNFLYIYYYMLGAAQRRHYELITSAFLSPLYWVLISFATYKALLEFLLRPFHWQKTTHGLHLSPESQSAFPGISAPEPDVDEGAPAAAQALPVAAVGGRAWAE
ncbi:MAG: glycosyltransferase family 2 protein, partial [Candidatus Dormibacteria bacterium]